MRLIRTRLANAVVTQARAILSFSWLLPVSQAVQLSYDFEQSLKPPFVVGCCGAVFRRARIFAVRFVELSYFLP